MDYPVTAVSGGGVNTKNQEAHKHILVDDESRIYVEKDLIDKFNVEEMKHNTHTRCTTKWKNSASVVMTIGPFHNAPKQLDDEVKKLCKCDDDDDWTLSQCSQTSGGDKHLIQDNFAFSDGWFFHWEPIGCEPIASPFSVLICTFHDYQ